jgi:hypothetical protein
MLRGNTLEQYDVCRQVLAEEHCVEPPELYQQILVGKPSEAL